MVSVELVARNVFGISLQVSDELSGYLLVVVTFFCLADSFSSGALMRIEFVYASLSGRARLLADLFFDLAAALSVLACIVYSASLALSSFERQSHAPTLLATPLWLPQAAIPIGLSILLLALVLSIADDAVRLRRGPAS